jgi:hypothetical protein
MNAKELFSEYRKLSADERHDFQLLVEGFDSASESENPRPARTPRKAKSDEVKAAES